MIDRWSDTDADRLVDELGTACDRDIALRLYTARLLGQDSSLVLHGGGNVSFKGSYVDDVGDTREALYVKGSGCDLASLELSYLPALDLDGLRRFEQVATLDDAQLVRAMRRHLFDPEAPTPSVETFVHAFLPHRYVDHSHADAVLVLTNQPNDSLLREAIGDQALILPYVRPGFELARQMLSIRESLGTEAGAIVLVRHGLFTFGQTR